MRDERKHLSAFLARPFRPSTIPQCCHCTATRCTRKRVWRSFHGTRRECHIGMARKLWSRSRLLSPVRIRSGFESSGTFEDAIIVPMGVLVTRVFGAN